MPYPQVNAAAHGEAYWKLVNGDGDAEGWDVRFTGAEDGSAQIVQG